MNSIMEHSRRVSEKVELKFEAGLSYMVVEEGICTLDVVGRSSVLLINSGST